MKILHTGDLHLGISLCGRSLLPYQQALPQLLSEASGDCQAVLIAGDIFDSVVSSSEAIRLYDAIVTRLCLEDRKKVIIIAGNHDGGTRLASCGALLERSGLHVFGRLEWPLRSVDLGECVVWPLPFFNSEELNILPSELLSAAGENASFALKTGVLMDYIRSQSDGRPQIILGHCFVAGGQTEESDTAAKLMSGGSMVLPERLFQGFSYVALGHLHRPQTLGTDRRIRYAGTPFPYAFSEANPALGFSVYDVQTAEFRHLNIPSPYSLVVLEEEYERLLDLGRSGRYRDCMVKISMKDRFAGQETFRQLKELFPNLLHFSGCPLPEDSEELTLAEISQFTGEELLERFMQERTGLPPTEQQLEWFHQAVEEAQGTREVRQ